MTKYIIKIVSFFFLPLLCLSLFLYFSGIRYIQFDGSFYALFKSISLHTINIQIPSIPTIQEPDITNGFLAFTNFLIQFINFLITILNVLVTLLNVIIRVLMFVFNFLTALVSWVISLPKVPPLPPLGN